jgi:pimeloyl-ACP methyl ester carboxylesterase
VTAPIEERIPLRSHLTLTAQIWGKPDAPPLLALHGWLDNAGSFAFVAPMLAKHWRVILLELPGHGHSGHLPAGGTYHYLDYVSAVLAAVDALHLQRYSLLGHSLGAGIGSLAAAARPQCIERLYLIEGLGPLGDDGSNTLQRFRDAYVAKSTKSASKRVFADIDQAISARTLASGLRADLARPIVERGLVEVDDGWRWRSDSRLTRPSPLRMAESQICTLLSGIEAPTSLLLASPVTPYLPTALMQARAARVNRITTTHMEGGHHLQLEHPDAVATWLMAQANA